MNSPLKVSLENIIPLTEARDHFSQIVTEVQKDKLYVLTKGGKPAVALIDVKYLESISGGSVRPDNIESEIQKDPAKVGRTPMIKHEVKPAPQPIKPEPISSLVFPESSSNENNTQPATDATKPAEGPQPIKINFQPATNSEQSNSSTTPPVSSLLNQNSTINNVAPPTNPTPPANPAMPPANQPTPAAQMPVAPEPINFPPATSSTNPTNQNTSSINMISTGLEPAAPANNPVSPDDRPGPAQYAGEDDEEPLDMEI